MKANNTQQFDRWVRWAWGIALLVLVVITVWRMGGFNLTSTLPSGRTVPDTYATVDHPFHASRAAVLLESIKDGEILRWMGSHQGGYPVEFYPLGAAWLDVVLWAGMFGSVSILAVHKLAVALVFVLPALAYWLLVRGDKLHPSIAFLAMSFHVAIPGHWLNGGYEELVGWGLVTNVAGATLGLLSTVLLTRYVITRSHWAGVAAVITIAAGAVTNPRSLFGIVLASLAIAIWYLISASDRTWREKILDLVIRIGIVGGLALFLAAPVVLSLMRYNGEYFFLHYQFYEPLTMFWDALRTALSLPILLLSIGGGALVLVISRRNSLGVSSSIALSALLYAVFTTWVASTDNPPPLVQQLEAPRLMPYQRYLLLALAAMFVVVAVQWLAAKLSAVWRESVIAIVVLGISTGSMGMMANRGDDVLANEQSMYAVETVGDQRFADMEDATLLAKEIRPEGTSVFVIGNQDTWWHEQLWAPGIANGTYYYDDWLWYWHTDQTGPYDWTQGYWMENPTDALTAEYFDDHGISVVMVSDMWVPSGVGPRQAASQNPLLEHQATFGAWDVYQVVEPGSMVTRGDQQPAEVEWSNQEIRATFEDGEGGILIRQNWFPRWTAEINGEPARINLTDSGYMEIESPDGPVEITLSYGVTPMDWTSRAMSMLGAIGLGAFAWRGRRVIDDGVGEKQHAAE